MLVSYDKDSDTVVHHLPNVKPEKVIINNTDAVQAFGAEGGRILHVRPSDGKRGITFAYKRKGGRVTFSTAVQHRHDDFTKKMGTKLALEHFNDGKVVSLPIDGVNTDIVGCLQLVGHVIQF